MNANENLDAIDGPALVMQEVRELLSLKRKLRDRQGAEFADQMEMASIDAREMNLLEELDRLSNGGKLATTAGDSGSVLVIRKSIAWVTVALLWIAAMLAGVWAGRL